MNPICKHRYKIIFFVLKIFLEEKFCLALIDVRGSGLKAFPHCDSLLFVFDTTGSMFLLVRM